MPLDKRAGDLDRAADPGDRADVAANAALHEYELPFLGRFFAILDQEGEEPDPDAMFTTEVAAERELARRRALGPDDDEYATDHHAVFSVDVEGVFWNSYGPNPRPVPTSSRLWEMQVELERMTEARDAALAEVERSRPVVDAARAWAQSVRDRGGETRSERRALLLAVGEYRRAGGTDG